ncbi:MAG TPA: DUF1402 family protein [Gemmatimonadota bacterium]|nr:DUF1402 family protein [Gemmatimonadota bacterium]
MSRRSRGGRAGGRKRTRWLAGAAAVALAALALAWWADRGPASSRDEASDARESPAIVTRDGVLVIHGNPGWESLSREDRRRAATPLSAEARAWLRAEGVTVRQVAAAFEVSPVALGGIVAAEKTLLVGRVDALGEDLFHAVFGSLREQDLERWVSDQEAAFQAASQQAAEGGSGNRWRSLRQPYLWTLGPAQVSFRLAVRYEPVIARRLARPERDVSEILDAMTSVPGNLEYAAVLLAEAERAYLEIAHMEISENPGVLATLYHLGAPTVRARRLAAVNDARRARGERPKPPHVNYYGAFVNHHAGEIAAMLEIEAASR